jgi:hypothetical protein
MNGKGASQAEGEAAQVKKKKKFFIKAV